MFRVIARLFGIHEDTSQAAVKKHMRELVASMQPEDRPGDFTQAMMELGALICIPGGVPKCEACPFMRVCRGAAQGDASKLPVKKTKKIRRVEKRTLIFIILGEKAVIYKRPEGGLLPGLYEPLNLPGWKGPEEIKKLLKSMGARVRHIDGAPQSRHVFSHLEWEMRAYFVFADFMMADESAVFADAREIQTKYAFPSAFKEYKVALMSSLHKGELYSGEA